MISDFCRQPAGESPRSSEVSTPSIAATAGPHSPIRIHRLAGSHRTTTARHLQTELVIAGRWPRRAGPEHRVLESWSPCGRRVRPAG